MKIALYSRVSSEAQEQERTIDSQIADIEEWALKNNHIITGKYIDNGYSGTLLARPELDRLRDDASKGMFEAIAVHSPDRLARKYIYQEIVIEELRNKEIQTVFINRPIAETPEDQLLLGVQGIIAEYERGKLLERTRRGRLHRVKSGHILGNIPPYGYNLVKKADSSSGFAYYKINQEESAVVKKIFSLLVDEKMSTYSIVCELNRLRIPARKGNRWVKSSIAKIVRNETYTGKTYYNKHYGVPSSNTQQKYHRRKNTTFKLRPKDEWIPIEGIPAIIESSTFLKAQRQLGLNTLLSDRNSKNSYLLRGLLKCMNDHRSYYGVPMHSVPYYRCSGKSKMVSSKKCSSASIKADKIEQLVWNTVVDLMNNPQLILNQLKRRASEGFQATKQLDEKVKGIEVLLAKVEIEEARLLKAYSEDVISIEQLSSQNMRLNEKKSVLLQEIDEINRQRINNPSDFSLQSARIYFNTFKSTLINLTFSQKQKIIRTILKEIQINGNTLLIRGFLPVLPRNDVLRPQHPSKGAARSRKNIDCQDYSLNSSTTLF